MFSLWFQGLIWKITTSFLHDTEPTEDSHEWFIFKAQTKEINHVLDPFLLLLVGVLAYTNSLNSSLKITK